MTAFFYARLLNSSKAFHLHRILRVDLDTSTFKENMSMKFILLYPFFLLPLTLYLMSSEKHSSDSLHMPAEEPNSFHTRVRNARKAILHRQRQAVRIGHGNMESFERHLKEGDVARNAKLYYQVAAVFGNTSKDHLNEILTRFENKQISS